MSNDEYHGESEPVNRISTLKIDRSPELQRMLNERDEAIKERDEAKSQMAEIAQKSFDSEKEKAISEAERLNIPIGDDLSTPSQLEFLKSQIQMKQDSSYEEREKPTGIISLRNQNASGSLARRVFNSPQEARVEIDKISRMPEHPQYFEAIQLKEELANRFLELPLKRDSQDLIKTIGETSLTDRQQQDYVDKTGIHPLFGQSTGMFFYYNGFKIPNEKIPLFNQLRKQGKI